MKKNKTIFEKIVDREIPATIIYEDEKYLSFLNAFPFEPGHVLVIPKKAYNTIFEMTEKNFLELQKVVFKIASRIKKVTNQDIAIIQRNGVNAGQEIPHVHFHIIPRTISEKEKPLFNDYKGELISEDESKKFKLMFDLGKNMIK